MKIATKNDIFYGGAQRVNINKTKPKKKIKYVNIKLLFKCINYLTIDLFVAC